MITVYGIRQCDSCRKTLKWLAERGVQHEFHDFRVDGLDAGKLLAWLDSGFADVLVNRRSTTWRQLSNAERSVTGDALVRLLLDRPTLIRRPVLDDGGIVAVGFEPDKLLSLVRT